MQSRNGRGTPTNSSKEVVGAMSDWQEEILKTSGLWARIIWTRGVKPGEWKVTGQCYAVEEGKVVVRAEEYIVWPSRGYKTPESVMLNLLVRLEKAVGQVMILREPDV